VLKMVKMLTDEQLNPMRRGAPLLAEAYRALRNQVQEVIAPMLAASTESLKLAREALQKEQARVKELELQLDEAKAGWKDASEARDAAWAEIEGLKERL